MNAHTAHRRSRALLLLFLLAAGAPLGAAWGQPGAAAGPPPDTQQAMNEGRWDDAYRVLRDRLLKGAAGRGADPARELTDAVTCLERLGRIDEFDALAEGALDRHGADAELLRSAAAAYLRVPHHGAMVEGAFRRGDPRGPAKVVNATQRDRTQALRLLVRATRAPGGGTAALYRDLADALMGGAAWRLTGLTPLETLPDYDDGWHSGGDGPRGAPVDAEGDPVYYPVPASWEAAKNDGQRWRWALARWGETGADALREAEFARANFLHEQFGVQTMAGVTPLAPRAADDDAEATGTYALHTLAEDETVARLATGVRRFKLPAEHNPIRVYQGLLDDAAGAGAGAPARYQVACVLASLFEDRRQYPRAAEYWRQASDRASNEDEKRNARQRLAQVVDPWGQFEPVGVRAAGDAPTFEFRYRNAPRVEFVAQRVDTQRLLKDVQEYLAGGPKRLDWQQMDVSNLGYRLVTGKQRRYLGGEAARWTVELDPAEGHFDRRATVEAPLKEAGAYLVTARIAGGEGCQVVLWVADTAIVRKPLEGESLYAVLDAKTGAPVPGARLELFGWRQFHEGVGPGGFRVATRTLEEVADAQGLVRVAVDAERQTSEMQWLATARTEDGRFAYLGFNGVWQATRSHERYDAVRAYIVTDRPVYRPGQAVHVKAWVQRATYGDDAGAQDFAHKAFQVEVYDGRNEAVHKETLTADAYGAVETQFPLPAEASLGVWRVVVVNHGENTFRVEEYKKPEFEVTVEAPGEAVRLGESFKATIRARYYFGEPVANATVRYKVTRMERAEEWYPADPWDWLYGPGYWWHGVERAWLPGFAQWGCIAPRPPWFWFRPAPPEVVAEGEGPLGRGGVLEVPIDTALAKELHGDADHSYHVEAQVTDRSRRTIVGSSDVVVARQPFRAYAWTDQGHYRVGDTITVGVAARRPGGEPVNRLGTLRLVRLEYGDAGQPPKEVVVRTLELATEVEGAGQATFKASEPGQYRVSYVVPVEAGGVGPDAERPDAEQIEGGQLFVIAGDRLDDSRFHFNDLELALDRKTYAPGDRVGLRVSAARPGSTVLLFVRPLEGVYDPPRVLKLDGKSTVVELQVQPDDMPNFYVEAVAVADGKAHTVVRQVAVPPASRVLDVRVEPASPECLPGEETTLKLHVKDASGAPFTGELALTLYDKSVEYISGGTNAPDIRKFFWDWRHHHQPTGEDNLSRQEWNLIPPGGVAMQTLGVFGASVPEEVGSQRGRRLTTEAFGRGDLMLDGAMAGAPRAAAAPMAEAKLAGAEDAPGAGAEPKVRTEFADTALWAGAVQTDAAGEASVPVTMPENLTTWVARVWGVGHGALVGEGTAEVVTRKDLLVRLQTPRFLVERDAVVLTANVHNYLPTEQRVAVRLTLLGDALSTPPDAEREVVVAPGDDVRVDWRVEALKEGEATVRVAAVAPTASDATQVTLPVRVHGMARLESFSGALAADAPRGGFEVEIPADRRPEATRLEVRFTPTMAGAMIDALPYLIEYPHGCTEQTLNRFLPAVVTHETLTRMGIDLAAVRAARSRLDPQVRDPDARAPRAWGSSSGDAVYDPALLADVVKTGVRRLAEMQLSDGGWGWFTGYGEQSTAHTTAVVVRGLALAKRLGVDLPEGVLELGLEWLARHQAGELAALENCRPDGAAIDESKPHKRAPDNEDALVLLTLAEGGADAPTMAPTRTRLFAARTGLAPYGLAMLGLASHRAGDAAQRDAVVAMLRQFVETDAENQTAWLRLPGNGWWWWYGSEYETQAMFLKLLASADPRGDLASGLAKYLLNNRRHATYWNSTRDTALVIEALAEFLAASGEGRTELHVEVWLDGQKRKQVDLTPENLLTFDNLFALTGADLAAGRHSVELRKTGAGRLYYNAFLENFTTEDDLRAAGLEVRVRRRLFRLTPDAGATQRVATATGQAVDQRADKFRRTELGPGDSLASGDLVEVELTLESKNDYEYLILTDHKAAGFEPVDIRSGYNGNELGAYVEFRDERVDFFLRQLPRGQRSVSYRLRAEAPGRFSALPAVVEAMYAPQLKGNSASARLGVEDTP